MEREKEIAKELCRHFIKTMGYDRLYCPHCSEENIPCGFATNIVKIVKKSIIPEGAVVVSKEEHRRYMQMMYDWNAGKIDFVENARKETAREILKKLNGFRFVMYDEGYEVASWTCDEDNVKQFAKEIGVEVE